MYHGKMLAIFFTVFVLSFLILHAIPLPGLKEVTASGSSIIMNGMGFDSSSHGVFIYLNGFPEAEIIPSCTGIDSISLILALAMADPLLDKRKRKWFLGLGIPALFAFNFFRIAFTLASPEWFPAHMVLWVASAGAVFLIWYVISSWKS